MNKIKIEKHSGMRIDEYRRTWFKGLPLRIKHFTISIKQFNQFHLMDDVYYKGEECFINNGTRYAADGTHLWDICKKEWNADDTRDCYSVPESELKKVKSWFTFKNSLLYHYEWWMRNWYKIELYK